MGLEFCASEEPEILQVHGIERIWTLNFGSGFLGKCSSVQDTSFSDPLPLGTQPLHSNCIHKICSAVSTSVLQHSVKPSSPPPPQKNPPITPITHRPRLSKHDFNLPLTQVQPRKSHHRYAQLRCVTQHRCSAGRCCGPERSRLAQASAAHCGPYKFGCSCRLGDAPSAPSQGNPSTDSPYTRGKQA